MRIDDGGPKHQWGNEDWPGLQPDKGVSSADWAKEVVYDDKKLESVVTNLRAAHEGLLKAADKLPKNMDVNAFGPPAGTNLGTGSAKATADHVTNGFQAFLNAWADLITKVEKTKAKKYSTEGDNKQRVQQANDWK